MYLLADLLQSLAWSGVVIRGIMIAEPPVNAVYSDSTVDMKEDLIVNRTLNRTLLQAYRAGLHSTAN